MMWKRGPKLQEKILLGSTGDGALDVSEELSWLLEQEGPLSWDKVININCHFPVKKSTSEQYFKVIVYSAFMHIIETFSSNPLRRDKALLTQGLCQNGIFLLTPCPDGTES